MRKRDIRSELSEFRCYIFQNGGLVEIPPPSNWNGLHLHHFITTQWQQNNPEKFEQVKHLQKLIFLPPEMHMDLHARHSKFKEKYGIEISELLFDWREYMITANKARAKSDANSIKLLRADIEKLINKAIEKGTCTAFKSGQVPEVIQEELKDNGFYIKVCPTGMKIMW